MMRSLIFIVLILTQGIIALGQNRQTIWPLSGVSKWASLVQKKLALDFTSGTAVIDEYPNDPLYYPVEALASICSADGKLLLYSDNIKVWDRTHALIANQDTLNADGHPWFSSFSRACLFIPFPGDTTDTKFYFFNTKEGFLSAPETRILQYSLIVLDAETGKAHIDSIHGIRYLSDGPIQEGITAIKHGNGRDYWIVYRDLGQWSKTLNLVHFSPTGILDTVVSSVPGTSYGFSFELSPSGNRMVETAINYDGTNSRLYYYSVDRCTGVLHLLDSVNSNIKESWYGLEFSNSGRYLYVSIIDLRVTLIQFNVAADSLYDPDVIVDFGGWYSLGQIQMGPDGRIYCAQAHPTNIWQAFNNYMSVIQYPEEEGMACGFDTFGVYLNGYYARGYALPNFPDYELGRLKESPCDSLPFPVVSSVQTPELEQESILLFPNPANTSFHFSEAPQQGEVLAFDAMGRMVWQSQAPLLSNAIDCSTWADGLYLVRWTDAQGSQQVARITVQHQAR